VKYTQAVKAYYAAIFIYNIGLNLTGLLDAESQGDSSTGVLAILSKEQK
jgi:hypothetical protein